MIGKTNLLVMFVHMESNNVNPNSENVVAINLKLL